MGRSARFPEPDERVVEDRERMLLDAEGILQAGSWAWDAASGRVQWSDELYRIHGLAPGQLPGTLDGLLGLLVPEDVDRMRALLEKAFASGETFETNYRIRRPDGAVRRLHMRGHVRVDGRGEPDRLVGVVEDVTERNVGEERFRALLESAPDAMVLADARGRVLLVNGQTERLFGYSRAELVGQPIEMLMPERFRARHEGHRGGYVREPRTRPMGAGLDLYGRRSDGSEFPVEISLSPVESAGERIVIAAIRDVTDRKRAEDDLKAARVSRPLVRRIVRELVDRTAADRNTLLAVGGAIAAEADAEGLPGFIRAFEEMGLGRLSVEAEGEDRLVFAATDLIERREGARLTTCFLTTGYLSGAVGRVRPGARVLGMEVACQSRGDPRCEFIVQARWPGRQA